MKSEEVELDEVSSALLNRYRDAAKTSDTSGMSKTKQLKRREQLPNLAQAKVAAGKSDEASRHTLNRYKMTGGKVKVPATEEVEHVEESGLSKKTLANYITKASSSTTDKTLSAKKIMNRYAGVHKADKDLDAKMKSEEVEQVEEGIKEKIGGMIRRSKQKDSWAQSRRDVALNKAGDSYAAGKPRNAAHYLAYAERDRKKHNDPSSNPTGKYRIKVSDYD